MRLITLLRHAKAVPEFAGGDFLRPLSKRGLAQAREAASTCQTEAWIPDLILASPATRTRETARIISESLRPPAKLCTDPALYLAPPAKLLDALAALPDTARHVLLVGHNPGLSELAASLLHEPSLDSLQTGKTIRLKLTLPAWSGIYSAIATRLVTT